MSSNPPSARPAPCHLSLSRNTTPLLPCAHDSRTPLLPVPLNSLNAYPLSPAVPVDLPTSHNTSPSLACTAIAHRLAPPLLPSVERRASLPQSTVRLPFNTAGHSPSHLIDPGVKPQPSSSWLSVVVFIFEIVYMVSSLNLDSKTVAVDPDIVINLASLFGFLLPKLAILGCCVRIILLPY